MYIPAEDSYLLAEIVKLYSGECALEIGVGTGIVLNKLCDSFKVVIGTDIHYDSLVYCLNSLSKTVSLVCCDAASALKGKFDLIVSNPPYLPQDSIGTSDPAIYGGLYGYELALHFVRSSLPLLNIQGKILFVVSNRSNIIQMYSLVKPMSLNVRIVGRKKLFFETLYVFEISKL